jgi:hypothetical protein
MVAVLRRVLLGALIFAAPPAISGQPQPSLRETPAPWSAWTDVSISRLIESQGLPLGGAVGYRFVGIGFWMMRNRVLPRAGSIDEGVTRSPVALLDLMGMVWVMPSARVAASVGYHVARIDSLTQPALSGGTDMIHRAERGVAWGASAWLRMPFDEGYDLLLGGGYHSMRKMSMSVGVSF